MYRLLSASPTTSSSSWCMSSRVIRRRYVISKSNSNSNSSRSPSVTTTFTNTPKRQWFSDKASSSGTSTSTTATTTTTAKPRSTSGPMEFRNATERHEYLKAANAEMERYSKARDLLRQGKLKSKNNHSTNGRSSESGNLATGMTQLGVVTLFLVAFLATPMLGKRIATDDEFRQKYVPAWYDFTVPKPEKPWTREELHEQMIAVQREIRERAIRGEFSPEKLQELQKTLQTSPAGEGNPSLTSATTGRAAAAYRASLDPSDVRKEWARIHPGVEDGEEVNED